MASRHDILSVLQDVQSGALTPEDALLRLKLAPFEDLGYVKVDYHRAVRQGVPEVIYGQSKTKEQISGILSAMEKRGCVNILVTRIQQETANYLAQAFPLRYEPLAKLAVVLPQEVPGQGSIVVATGGTSDMGVAEEAAITAETLGNRVTRLYDVGVAGLHRLLGNLEPLMSARVVIAVAGMEGALASVVGGLVDCPVIAVPTSVGYGASLGGISALLSMLNSWRQRNQRGEYRQRLRRGLPGQPDQSDGECERMKTLYLECNMGTAGDMLMAALYELMTESEKHDFLETMNRLFPAVEIHPRQAVTCGITGTHMDVTVCGEEEHSHDVALGCGQNQGHIHEHHHDHDHDHGHHHHTAPADITALLETLDIPAEVRDSAKSIYARIADAESKAHGMPVEQIHFHEVGAMDAVADVVGVCLAIHMLHPDCITASPVHLGSGQIRCAHGIVPGARSRHRPPAGGRPLLHRGDPGRALYPHRRSPADPVC